MNYRKILSALTAAALTLCMTACGADSTREGGTITTADLSRFETVTETSEAEDFGDGETDAETDDDIRMIEDREGNVIEVRENVRTIVSAAPSITEILEGLGLSGKIIAADVYSADVDGIDPSVCTLEFSNLNIEELTALAPDLIIVSGMSMNGADDPYAALKEAGVNVVYIPTSESVAGVKEDIEFLASYLGAEQQGAELIADITDAVNDITEKASGITEKKSVYFEISAAPYLYSCGKNTFIDELITLAGAENIYGGEEGWISNSEESVIAADPDVILTNVQYDGYDFNEIKSRAGWENIAAVKNGAVYSVGANETSRPSQHIVEGMYQIAEAVYPEVFAE
ncbi:MAG: ABC transporter substrate-binding protein [Prevotella sp.]|nr:ABC transporter substrate-binding protein [Prevotella sp.]